MVALPAEGVDRNQNGLFVGIIHAQVALPAEGVDRNWRSPSVSSSILVALPAEGVDRNKNKYLSDIMLELSPSPRRAWIEI